MTEGGLTRGRGIGGVSLLLVPLDSCVRRNDGGGLTGGRGPGGVIVVEHEDWCL